MYAADRASQMLGMSLEAAVPGMARMRMPIRPEMMNGHGTCHGGLVFALADSTFAFACNGYGVVTVAAGADVTFLAPVHSGDVLVAEARERARRGRSGIYDVSVRRESDGEVVAEFRGRSRSLGPASPALATTDTSTSEDR